MKTRVSINSKKEERKKNLLTETMTFSLGSDFLDQSLRFPMKIRIAFALSPTKLFKNHKKNLSVFCKCHFCTRVVSRSRDRSILVCGAWGETHWALREKAQQCGGSGQRGDAACRQDVGTAP